MQFMVFWRLKSNSHAVLECGGNVFEMVFAGISRVL